MATIHHHPYNPGGATIPVGGSQGFVHGPDSRYESGTVYVTAIAEQTGPEQGTQTLAVPEVRISTVPFLTRKEFYLDYRVVNRGPNPVHQYHINITIITP